MQPRPSYCKNNSLNKGKRKSWWSDIPSFGSTNARISLFSINILFVSVSVSVSAWSSKKISVFYPYLFKIFQPTVLTVALLVQCCICLSSVTLCIVAKRCILEQKLGSRIWEIDWYQNEWPWPLFIGRIKVTSTVALHFTLNISETVRDRGLVPKDYQ